MKLTRSIYLFCGIAILLYACASSPATPAIKAEDVNSTSVSAAMTIVAETQAAVPTDTAISPTDATTQTPVPTDTLVALPTETPIAQSLPSLEASATATQPPQAGGNTDPCNAPLQSISGGNPAKIKIENNTGAQITLSLYLNKTAFGDCGYRGYVIGRGGSILITDLIQACYNVSVYVNDPKKPTKSFGYGCINNPDKWTFIVTRDSVVLQGR